MITRDYVIGFLLIAGICVAIFSIHYRIVLKDMVNMLTMLFVPLFFIIIAIAFFAGANVLTVPGMKTMITTLIVLLLLGGVSATLGNDVVNQLSGNAITPTDAIFNKDFLNAAVILVVGISIFFVLLIKK